MRHAATALAVLATALSSCGPKTIALSSDPIEMAATCGVVAAANARVSSTTVTGPLGFDEQLAVMHYPLLAASSGDQFSRDEASAVIKRMQVIQEDVTKAKWKALVAPCQSAFPDADPIRPVTLPKDRYATQIGCYALVSFVGTALKGQGETYDDDLMAYRDMQATLDGKIAAGMAKRGIRTDDAMKAARDHALAQAVKWGSPGKVMDSCRTTLT